MRLLYFFAVVGFTSLLNAGCKPRDSSQLALTKAENADFKYPAVIKLNLVNAPSVFDAYFSSTSAKFYHCTGTIVSPHLILTAAHCLNSIVSLSFEDWAGNVQETRYHFSHPQYNHNDTNNAHALYDIGFAYFPDIDLYDVQPTKAVVDGKEKSFTLADTSSAQAQSGESLEIVGYGKIGDQINLGLRRHGKITYAASSAPFLSTFTYVMLSINDCAPFLDTKFVKDLGTLSDIRSCSLKKTDKGNVVSVVSRYKCADFTQIKSMKKVACENFQLLDDARVLVTESVQPGLEGEADPKLQPPSIVDNAGVRPGDSGSPLFRKGSLEIIGIGSQWVSFATFDFGLFAPLREAENVQFIKCIMDASASKKLQEMERCSRAKN